MVVKWPKPYPPACVYAHTRWVLKARLQQHMQRFNLQASGTSASKITDCKKNKTNPAEPEAVPFQCTVLIKLLRRPQQEQQGMLDTRQIRPRTCACDIHIPSLRIPTQQCQHQLGKSLITIISLIRAYKHLNNSFSLFKSCRYSATTAKTKQTEAFTYKSKSQIKIVEHLPLSLPFPGDDQHAHFNIMCAFQRKLLLRSHFLGLSEDYVFTLHLYH